MTVEVTEELVALIEQAARASVPWPDRDHWDYAEEERLGDAYEPQPMTLEQFVDGTYISGENANRVFRAAALSVANALAQAGSTGDKE